MLPSSDPIGPREDGGGFRIEAKKVDCISDFYQDSFEEGCRNKEMVSEP